MATLMVGVIATVTCLALSPWAARVPRLVALPSEDRWHRHVTPVTGGLAIAGGFLLAAGLAGFGGEIARLDLIVVLGAAAAGGLGLYDDIRTISPRRKLAGQVLVAALAVAAGLRPDWLPAEIGAPLSVLALVGAMNSVNLLDNMDGLAAGTSAVAALGLVGVATVTDGAAAPLVAAALAGACLGFLPANYRLRRPAAMFMGDSGSHLLGFALAGLAILASPRGAGGIAATVLAPLLILAVPMLDTTLVTVMRLIEGRPIHQGGRDHCSHRLVWSGFGERVAVGLLVGLGAFSAVAAVAIIALDDPLVTAALAGVVFASLVAIAARLSVMGERAAEATIVPFRIGEPQDDPEDARAAL